VAQKLGLLEMAVLDLQLEYLPSVGLAVDAQLEAVLGRQSV
jgi:hypothetical protein